MWYIKETDENMYICCNTNKNYIFVCKHFNEHIFVNLEYIL